jgi:hypothetical protein
MISGPLHWAAGTVLAILAAWMTVTAVRRYRSRAGLAVRIPMRSYAALAGSRC